MVGSLGAIDEVEIERTKETIYTLNENLTAPVREGPRATCEGLIDILLADFTTLPTEAPAAAN